MTEEPGIVVDEEGVAVVHPKTGAAAWRVWWADVTQIVAWKDDAFTFDIICMGFRVGGGPGAAEGALYVRCDEEQPGWKQLLEAVGRVFGVRLADWWVAVTLPAFAENPTILWEAPHRNQVE